MKKLNVWSILSTLFILMVLLPNIDVLVHLFSKPNENWIHIKQYLLKDFVINTATIVIITGFLTMIIGTSLAWIISVYDFPMRNFFRWALILPLAIPTYIAAYTYNGMISYTGVVQKFLRETIEISVNPKYFDIMSINGAIFIFTIFLFPYVYMIVRSFLEKQSSSLIENARLLGSSSFEIFFKIVLPISRGVIVSGVALVILEVLNDYGVVAYFGIQTFSSAIFKTWFSMRDIDSAVRLSSILLASVFLIMILEKSLRGRKKYSFTNTKVKPIQRKRLDKIHSCLAFGYCFIILALGFIIPTLQLFSWSILSYKEVLSEQFINLIYSSLWIAIVSSILVVIASIIIANYCRMSNSILSKIYSRLTLFGYSIPGAVIAITVILFFVDIDSRLSWLYKAINPDSPNLVLSMSIIMLIFAYFIRFLAIGYQSIEGGFEKVGKTFFEASRTLGNGVTKTFFLVDLPMIKPAILSALALTFVDIIKELPLALILRPFNFNTLATKTFEYANDEMIHEASIPSLFIIMVSFIAIFILYKLGEREEN